MKNALFAFITIMLPGLGLAQISTAAIKPNCDSLLRAGDKHLRRQGLQQALQCYLGALNCDTRLAGKVGPKIEEVFKEMDKQKRNLKNALNKAEILIGYFNFENEPAAWAYNSSTGQFAVIDRNGVRLSEFIYESPEPFQNGVAIAKVYNQFVFIKENGAAKSGRYDYLIPVTEGRYIAGIADVQPILVNRQGDPEANSFFELYSLLNPYADQEHDYMLFLEKGKTPWEAVKKDGKWTFLDTAGRTMITLQYSYVGDFQSGLAPVGKDGKWGFIDINGREAIVRQFEFCEPFQEGLAAVEKDGSWGFIDQRGQEIIALKYEEIGQLHEGLAKIKKAGKWGFVDTKGQEVIPPQYEAVDVFLNGLAWIRKDGKWGIIDITGQEIVPAQYENSGRFSEGSSAVNKDGKWMFIDTAGRVVLKIQEQYEWVAPFFEGFAVVEKNGKRGFIDNAGKEVVIPTYEAASSFSGGLAWVKRDEKWGLMDTAKREVISPRYDEIRPFFSPIRPFSEGRLAWVKKDDKWGLIDMVKMEIAPPQFENVEPFFEGFAIVTKEKKQGLLDSTGKETLLCEYTKISKSGYRVFLLEQNNHFGLFAPDHNILLACNYEQIGYVGEENGWIRVKQNGKWGWVACEKDKRGKLNTVVKIPCRFDAVTPFENGKARVIQLPYPSAFKINQKGEMLF